MSTVIANMSMSLDGFVEDREGDVDLVPVVLGAGKPSFTGLTDIVPCTLHAAH